MNVRAINRAASNGIHFRHAWGFWNAYPLPVLRWVHFCVGGGFVVGAELCWGLRGLLSADCCGGDGGVGWV